MTPSNLVSIYEKLLDIESLTVLRCNRIESRLQALTRELDLDNPCEEKDEGEIIWK